MAYIVIFKFCQQIFLHTVNVKLVVFNGNVVSVKLLIDSFSSRINNDTRCSFLGKRENTKNISALVLG